MNTQASHALGMCKEPSDWTIHANVPELDFTCCTSRYQLTHATSLHVRFYNPGFVFFPNLHHRVSRCQTAIVYPNCSIAETSYEDVASNLFRRQAGDTGPRACGDVLCLWLVYS